MSEASAVDAIRQRTFQIHPGESHFWLRDGMCLVSDIDDLLSQLDALKRSDQKPFPYEGCRRLQAALRAPHHALIPDLDVYLSEVAGYRSWGRGILRWSDEKIETVEKRLHDSFFDRFPAYAELEAVLSSSEASDVSNALRNADRTRAVLVELLSAIRRARTATSSGSRSDA